MNSSAQTPQRIDNGPSATRSRRPQAAANDAVQGEIHRFFETWGRRPRILIGRPNQDNGRRRANEAATRFARHGFDVDISPANIAPRQLARMAMENDVHLVCLLSDDDAARELAAALGDLSCEDIGIIACAPHPADAGGNGAQVSRIDPNKGEDILKLLKKVMTTCPKL